MKNRLLEALLDRVLDDPDAAGVNIQPTARTNKAYAQLDALDPPQEIQDAAAAIGWAEYDNGFSTGAKWAANLLELTVWKEANAQRRDDIAPETTPEETPHTLARAVFLAMAEYIKERPEAAEETTKEGETEQFLIDFSAWTMRHAAEISKNGKATPNKYGDARALRLAILAAAAAYISYNSDMDLTESTPDALADYLRDFTNWTREQLEAARRGAGPLAWIFQEGGAK